MRRQFPKLTTTEIQDIDDRCVECNSIDPAPVMWYNRELDAKLSWWRWAMDVTHYNRKKYLSVIDCGPSRFAIWREIASEEAPVINRHLEQIFREHGSPVKVLMYNGTSFRS